MLFCNQSRIEHWDMGPWSYHSRIVLSIVHWHIATLACIVVIGKQLTHKVLQGKPPLLKHASFAILGKHHIVWRQRGGRPDRNAFFTSRDLEKGIRLLVK